MKVIRILIIMCLASTVIGCFAYKIPPPLTSAQLADLEKSPYSELVVGIDFDNDQDNHVPYYAQEEFIMLFNKSKLFKEVQLRQGLSEEPDLLVKLKSISRYPRCATGEASAMIITLGIIPMYSSDQIYTFSITNPRNSKAVSMEFEYTSRSFWGSLVMLLNLLPSWSFSPDEQRDEQRNVDLFAHQLVSRHNEILAIAEKIDDEAGSTIE